MFFRVCVFFTQSFCCSFQFGFTLLVEGKLLTKICFFSASHLNLFFDHINFRAIYWIFKMQFQKGKYFREVEMRKWNPMAPYHKPQKKLLLPIENALTKKPSCLVSQLLKNLSRSCNLIMLWFHRKNCENDKTSQSPCSSVCRTSCSLVKKGY